MLKSLWPFLLYTSAFAGEPVYEEMEELLEVKQVVINGHDYYVIHIHDERCEKCSWDHIHESN